MGHGDCRKGILRGLRQAGPELSSPDRNNRSKPAFESGSFPTTDKLSALAIPARD